MVWAGLLYSYFLLCTSMNGVLQFSELFCLSSAKSSHITLLPNIAIWLRGTFPPGETKKQL